MLGSLAYRRGGPPKSFSVCTRTSSDSALTGTGASSLPVEEALRVSVLFDRYWDLGVMIGWRKDRHGAASVAFIDGHNSEVADAMFFTCRESVWAQSMRVAMRVRIDSSEPERPWLRREASGERRREGYQNQGK